MYIHQPTVYLFLYDLKQGFGSTGAKIQERKTCFYAKMPSELVHKLRQEPTPDDPRNFFLLLKKEDRYFEEGSLERLYYPTVLGDTYGLVIGIGVKAEASIEWHSYKTFARLRQEIKKSLGNNQPTLGQTWMLTGHQKGEQITDNDAEEQAQKCYEAFNGDQSQSDNFNLEWNQEQTENQGKFLGGHLFELSSDSPKEHTIVILYPDAETADEIGGKIIPDWTQLFHYYHKITFSYVQSSKISSLSKSLFGKIEEVQKDLEHSLSHNSEQINDIEKNLQSLKSKKFKYNDYLHNLTFQNQTIDVNLDNYTKQLKAIKKKAIKNSKKVDLSLLEEFANFTTEKYKLQIQKDIEFFEQGLKLLENNMSAVNTQIEFNKNQIELIKNERNRKFQTLVSVGGAAIATANIAAHTGEYEGNCKLIIKPIFKLFGNQTLKCDDIGVWWVSPLFFNIYVALICSCIVGSITLWIRRKYQ